SRASRRLKWATEMFWRLRKDLAMGAPLDPELREAILKKGRGHKVGAKPPASEAAAPPASAIPPDSAADQADDLQVDPRDNEPIVVPANIPKEFHDDYIITAALLRSKRLGTPLANPPSPPGRGCPQGG